MYKILGMGLAVAWMLLSTTSSVFAGGGPTPPPDWCATDFREVNPPWQITQQPSAISEPGCDSENTQYAITSNAFHNGNAAIRGTWAELEELRSGNNATYYNEWASTAPPDGWCATGPGRDENPPWQIVNIVEMLPDPLCGSDTIYAITADWLNNGNMPVYSQNWAELEGQRDGRNATYYNEWLRSLIPTPSPSSTPSATDTPMPTDTPTVAPTQTPEPTMAPTIAPQPTAAPGPASTNPGVQLLSFLEDYGALILVILIVIVVAGLLLSWRRRHP